MFIKNNSNKFSFNNIPLIRSLEFISSLFKRHNKEVYLVGGCIRDLLLGREPKDYDLCTNATVEEMKSIILSVRGLKTFDSGVKHGTITIIDKTLSQRYEITTYRIDGKYSDGRHPDSVELSASLEEDMKRRDLTINSLAYDILEDQLLMLDESFLNDLKYKVIRTVGDANERFSEDGLRMLRAIRFASQLDFSISSETYDAIKMNASLISKVSKERIRDELTKILLSNNPKYFELIITTGLEEYIFDGKTPFKEILLCKHDNPWHYTDVFHHTMDVVEKVPSTFELRWAALFHDTGKPSVKTLKEGTTDHYNYHGHQDKSVEIALDIMSILKFSNTQQELISKFVKYHDSELAECKNSKFKNILNEIGKDNFLNFIELKKADAMSHQISKDTKYFIDYIDKIKEKFINITTNGDALTLKDLAINGDDIVSDGFLNGKEIGDCLRWMLNIVLENPEYNTREKLLELLEVFKEMSFQST